MKSTSFCSINRLKKSTNLQMSQPVLVRLSKFPFSGLVFCSIVLMYSLLTWFSAVLNFLQNFCFKLNLPACHHPAPQVWLETELSPSTGSRHCHQHCCRHESRRGQARPEVCVSAPRPGLRKGSLTLESLHSLSCHSFKLLCPGSFFYSLTS